ncbi:MAG: integrase core domain-containing protein [Firmicutes bacterium]|nr:integrase core domain-containing protein [Bacillota bacterium]
MLRKLNVAPVKDLERYIPQPYETPKMPGIKWQIDVKWVPSECLQKIPGSTAYFRTGYRMYQYTCIDEATRKRFMFLYNQFGKKESEDFIKRCVVFFGYKPLIIQSDNGAEFTDSWDKERRARNAKAIRQGKEIKVHPFTEFLTRQGIRHDLIRPATPRHNGKVERSHRTDNQEFYAHHEFINLADARTKMKGWIYRYNTARCMSVLNYKTPQQKEDELLNQLRRNNNQANYTDLERTNNNRTIIVEKQGTITFVPRSEKWAFADRPIS